MITSRARKREGLQGFRVSVFRGGIIFRQNAFSCLSVKMTLFSAEPSLVAAEKDINLC